MKKSLETLGVRSSGLEDVKSIVSKKRSDEEVFAELDKLNSLVEKENYLKEILEKRPHGFVKSKRYLAELIKSKDLKHTFELIMSACMSSPDDLLSYLLLAEVAVEDKAWLIAKESLEITRWLCADNQKDTLGKVENLFLIVKDKIKNKEADHSNNSFWCSRTPDKYWILEKLYFQSKIKELIDLSFKLLDIFPENIKNYDIAYKALTLVDKKEVLEKFAEHIKDRFKNDDKNQNLYLGMIWYYFSDFNTSINYLKNVIKIDPINSRALFYLALNFLMTNNVKDFVTTSEKILPEPDPAFIALYFIFSAACDIEMNKSEFPNHKNIAREVANIFEKLLKNNQSEIVAVVEEKFKKLSYYLILPCLQLYLAEMYIKQNNLDNAREVLKDCTDSDVHRLNSWMYRLEGKDDLAEQELFEYRKKWVPDKKTGFFCKMVGLNLPEESPGTIEEIFKYVKDAYQQTKDLIRQFDLEYGFNAMTCVETGCQDCCKRTFPMVTYTEYLYMKNWLDQQSEEVKKHIREGSNKIANTYRERFKKEPPFMAGENLVFTKEYPLDFFFDCPFLGDNKCNTYESRPFSCRSYGFSSFDGITFKGCNYFFEQLKSATKLNNFRKVVDALSFFRFAKLTDEKLIGRKVMAPIPIWFAQDHTETLDRVKKAVQALEQTN